MKTWRIGVIGAGIMGMRMAEAMQRHGSYEVAAVFDPHPAAQRRMRSLLPGAGFCGSADELAAGADLDAVYIASPPAWHLPHMRVALAGGLAVLCEKPLASTIEEARAIRDLVARAGARCAVNFPFARSRAALRLAELVQDGLGTIGRATVTLRFSQWPRDWQEGAGEWLARPEQGGFTREVLSHFLFLAQRLFGPLAIESAELDRAPGRTETRLAARLAHAHGSLAVDAAVGGGIVDYNRFELEGSAGSAALTDWYRLEVPGQAPLERASPAPATLDAFARLLAGKADHGLATVDEALAVATIVETLLEPSTYA